MNEWILCLLKRGDIICAWIHHSDWFTFSLLAARHNEPFHKRRGVWVLTCFDQIVAAVWIVDPLLLWQTWTRRRSEGRKVVMSLKKWLLASCSIWIRQNRTGPDQLPATVLIARCRGGEAARPRVGRSMLQKASIAFPLWALATGFLIHVVETGSGRSLGTHV